MDAEDDPPAERGSADRRSVVIGGGAALALTGMNAAAASPEGVRSVVTQPAARGTAAPETGSMRTITLEEHFSIASIAARIDDEAKRARGYPPPGPRTPSLNQRMAGRLTEIGDARIADMDESGITMQVLSWGGPGADLLKGRDALQFARDVNDGLGGAVAARPDRFAGFAHLPVGEPAAAADELERCVTRLGFVGAMVNGTTNGLFLDHPSFEPLLARAARFDIPLYLHPNIPTGPVRDAYYADLPEPLGFILSTYGFGWHAEVAIHVLRLIFSGTLERHRRLKIVIGHMGEFLPMAVARTTHFAKEVTDQTMSRDVDQQLRDQVWVTTSGMFTKPPLTALIETFGIDRVLFSVDYPFSSNAEGRAFLEELDLPPSDMAKIAHGNADRLLKLNPAPESNQASGARTQ